MSSCSEETIREAMHEINHEEAFRCFNHRIELTLSTQAKVNTAILF